MLLLLTPYLLTTASAGPGCGDGCHGNNAPGGEDVQPGHVEVRNRRSLGPDDSEAYVSGDLTTELAIRYVLQRSSSSSTIIIISLRVVVVVVVVVHLLLKSSFSGTGRLRVLRQWGLDN